MKRQTGHPDMEALANFRAGLVEGIHGRQIAAHIVSCERCAQLSDQLSAVTWALASTPAPSLPYAVERRIGAAIAAEATARRTASLTAGSMADPSAPSAADSLAPAIPAAAERRPARRWSPRRALGSAGPRLRLSPVQVLVSVAACLLLAGLGYLLSVPGAAGMPSSAGAAPALRSVPASGTGSSGHRQGRDAISPTNASGPTIGSNGTAFLVIVSAIRYRKSTLRAQVSSQLAVSDPAPGMGGGPGSSPAVFVPPSSPAVFVPPSSLVGCVMHLTGYVKPAFVQRATYQAMPAYVIAVPDKAWVVGLSCTAAKPALITSVTLAPVG
jgi:hypothetical protein